MVDLNTRWVSTPHNAGSCTDARTRCQHDTDRPGQRATCMGEESWQPWPPGEPSIDRRPKRTMIKLTIPVPPGKGWTVPGRPAGSDHASGRRRTWIMKDAGPRPVHSSSSSHRRRKRSDSSVSPPQSYTPAYATGKAIQQLDGIK
jgi:hypothetical protein